MKSLISPKIFTALLCASILPFCCVGSAQAQDPFAGYLTSIPTVVSNISAVNSGSGSSAITTKTFTFSSKGGVNIVYAIMAYPQAAGVYPAVMFNHGGGGNAQTQAGNVQAYASRGYVSITCDLPSIAGAGNTPNSSGPWKSDPSGTDAPKFNVTGGPQNCRLTDAGVAALQAFNYMRAQANVDPNRMGISGSSWGGYISTLLPGLLGSKIKAAYSRFGCGYYDAGSAWMNTLAGMSEADRNTWLTYFDAGRRAPAMTSPYFVEEPSDDSFFWPEAVASTLNAIPGTKNSVCMPNLNHTSIAASDTMKQIYFDYLLKGSGSAFGNISLASLVTQGDGSKLVTMNASVPTGVSVSSVQLYYSVPPTNWQSRNWIAISTTHTSGTTYTATIPANLVSQSVNIFGNMNDSRTVSVSTVVYDVNGNKVTGGGVRFYPNTDYSGTAGQSLSAGNYTQSQLATLGVPNDWASSAIVPAGWTVTMYANDNFAGTSWTLSANTVDFTTLSPSANDQMSSCKVVSSGLANGTYKVIARHSSLALDVAHQSTTNGSPVQQWTYNGGNNQRWNVTSLGGNTYSIVGVQSGRTLEVPGSSTANGTLLDIWDSNNGANQKWNITPTDSGYYSVINVNSGLAMEVFGGVGATTNGAAVDQWHYGSGFNQQWSFQAP